MVKRYLVTFVPHYDRVGDWHGRRLIARNNVTDEFTLKQAQKVSSFLSKRGDKSIKITPLTKRQEIASKLMGRH